MNKGEIIKTLREKNGLSQTELAAKLNTTKQTIYKYENNIVTNIPSDKIEIMARLFNVSPAYIMGWLDTPNDTSLTHNTSRQNGQSDITTLSQSERDLIKDYRELSPQGQEYIRQTMFIAKQTYKKIDNYTVLEESSGA